MMKETVQCNLQIAKLHRPYKLTAKAIQHVFIVEAVIPA